ncbi:MAG: class I SAM-dependent methyltransferase [Deltaproteobacteria bacterium]|nr:class I SAM-dependent methyltransferase [Deltaproteobacteria bacterium]
MVRKKAPISDDRNRQAWDTLYHRTDTLVWGAEPVPVLTGFLERLTGQCDAGEYILDAGAGEGRNVPLLQQHFQGRIACCDASVAALTKLRNRFNDQTAASACALAQLPFGDGKFRFVLAWDVLTTLPDPEQALQEFFRILRPGGTLLCNLSDRRDGAAGEHMTGCEENGYLYRNNYFFQFPGKDAAAKMLAENGFLVIHTASCSWQEQGHPNYRAGEHMHVSNVFVAVKG